MAFLYKGNKNMVAEKTTLDEALEEITWNTPIPLLNDTDHSEPYPIEALPSIIQNAVTSYHEYGQQPLPLIACSALANVSLACQTLANVARDRVLISPVSLYFIVIAGSGERKSAADYTFSKVIRDWELKIRKKLMPELQQSQTLYQTWMIEKQCLLGQIRRNTLTGENTTDLKKELIKLAKTEPSLPLLPELFFEDATQEALAMHIAHGWPSASLWSDEGGIVMSGHGMQNNSTKFIALLNRLWDGKPFIAHRKTTKSFTVENRRLTVSLMMQPLILQHMLTKNDGVSRQSGFLSRSIIAYPLSTMGERSYQEPIHSLSALPLFHQRLIDCLNTSLSLDRIGCHQLPTLHFSTEAKITWVTFFNGVEAGLKDLGHWSSIKDFASKAAENAARLAALFHLFEGKEGNINHENTEKAIQLIKWHLLESRRILGIQDQSIQQQDALKLLNWITEKALQETTQRELQQYGPVRDKKKRNNAIKLLEENHYLKEIKLDGKTILLVNPNILNTATESK